MPFTLSHAAAALPLRHLLRGNAVFPALVIGCFIPDIPYFLPAPLCDINAHLLPGLLLFGIPCGWAVYVVWYGLLVEPCAALLPRAYAALVYDRSAPHAFTHRFWSVTLSLLAGAVSHIVWDAFTHRRGLVVHVWPSLAQPLFYVGSHALPPYFMLQHGSTMLGFVCLALHVRHRLRQVPGINITGINVNAQCAPQLATTHKIAVAAALSIATAGFVWYTFSCAHVLKLSPYNFVCTSISAATAASVLYALAWHVYRLRERQ
jgi:hypothetical protein